ncbi:hypothetical protein SAMN05216420_101407 [Nitrosospira sp. Nl5]|uniref:hypothetical protein n=1 Tax=Nitrosospira sp. Nl5 TaxID=200120 RepID=UPI000881694C|nr:hypothetical protein [Nitrosospira sp. Nl5]SCX94459.1 hypothetical protein SAMN05216420_101407 [Nitrosospira sp. Nl5]
MRLALLALLLLPWPVYAMPPALFVAIGLTAAQAAIASTVATIASIALTIGTTVFGAVQQKAAAKKAKRQAARAREDFLNSLQERTLTRIATEAPHVLVYGRSRVGSAVVAVFSSGENEEFKHLVCIHAAHECDAIEEIYIEGKALGTLDADGFVTSGEYYSTTTENKTETFATSPFTLAHAPSSAVKVIAQARFTDLLRPGVSWIEHREAAYTRSGNTITVTGTVSVRPPANPAIVGVQVIDYRVTYQYQKNTSQVRVKRHLGTADDTADASLLAEVPAKWASTAVLRGFCYTVVRLDLRQAAFQGGLPGVEVLLRGKKLYDLRTGLTAWSDNPALVIYDYLTSDFCGVDADDLPAAHFITAANVCEESQSFGNLYTCNGTVTADQDQANVLEAMADSMAGGITSTTWEIFAGKYVAPTVALTQQDIVGSLAVTPGISHADLMNGVRGQNVTAENLYVATDYPPYQNATYLASDGKDKYADINYPFTDTAQRVHNLARIEVEDQRNGFTFKAQFSYKAWDIHVGDRVTFTGAFFGQTLKVYRVTDKKYSPDSSIELTMKEDAASIWDLADTVTIDDTPNSDLPDPFVSAPLSFVTCDSGTDALLIQQDGTVVSRIHVTLGTTALASGLIEIEWKRDSETAWRKTTVTGDETEAYLSPVEDAVWYVVRARTVNPYFNVKSDWVYADLHEVLGKSEPPADITDLSIDGAILTWTEVTDLDLAGYVFRYHFGTNLDWGTAVALHSGIVTDSPFNLIALPYGSVTIMGKAVDTSGNESVNVATVFANLGDAPVANVLATNEFGPTFPGTLDNCTVSDGVVIANAADSFYGDDAQSFFGLDANSFYKPAAGFGKMVYETELMTVASVLTGSKMTLALVTEGVDVVVEYRISGEGSFYGPDSESFYGADSDGFYVPGPEAFDAITSTGFDANNPDSFYAVDVANFNPASPDSFVAVDLAEFSSTGSFYGTGTAVYLPWPGQISAKNADYQFRITVGSGDAQGKISGLTVTIDAPDIVESIADLAISSSGTAIPYTKDFTSIKTVNAQLQANGSGAVTVEIDKTSPLAPTIKAYNASHIAVSGATADLFIQGY